MILCGYQLRIPQAGAIPRTPWISYMRHVDFFGIRVLCSGAGYFCTFREYYRRGRITQFLVYFTMYRIGQREGELH